MSEFNFTKVIDEKKSTNRIVDYNLIEFGQKGNASSFHLPPNHFKIASAKKPQLDDYKT